MLSGLTYGEVYTIFMKSEGWQKNSTTSTFEQPVYTDDVIDLSIEATNDTIAMTFEIASGVGQEIRVHLRGLLQGQERVQVLPFR